MWTGQCPCREGVEGALCSNCAHNYYNRSSDLQSKRTHTVNKAKVASKISYPLEVIIVYKV